MKFGVMANPTKDIISEIKRIGEMGFDFVEITFEPPKHMVNDIMSKRSDILKALEDYNMFAVGHFGWWANFGEAYPAVKDAWIYEMKKALEVGSYIGITKQNLHAYGIGIEPRTPEFKKGVLDRWVSSLNELTKEAKRYDIKLMIENSDAGSISDKDSLNYILKNVKDLRFHLDTGHAMMWNKKMDGIKELFFPFKNRLEHIHIHDNRGMEDDHLPIGVAYLDYIWLAKMLKKIRYNKTVTFEVFTKDDDLVKLSMEKFKRLVQ
jgi:sugar phosphate isomerase/epimerase